MDQVVDVVGVGAERHPDAEAQFDLDAATHVEGPLGDGLVEASRHRGGQGGAGHVDEHDELVAAPAGQQLGVAQAVLEALGDLAQHTVAGGVAEAVVDRLEPVEIAEQHGHRVLGAGEPLSEGAVDGAATRETGEVVQHHRPPDERTSPMVQVPVAQDDHVVRLEQVDHGELQWEPLTARGQVPQLAEDVVTRPRDGVVERLDHGLLVERVHEVRVRRTRTPPRLQPSRSWTDGLTQCTLPRRSATTTTSPSDSRMASSKSGASPSRRISVVAMHSPIGWSRPSRSGGTGIESDGPRQAVRSSREIGGGPMSARRAPWPLLAILTAAVLLAACGDDDATEPGTGGTTTTTIDDGDGSTTTTSGDQTSSALPDPCALLTVDELQAATGIEFPEGEPNATLSNDSQVICDWVSEDPFATAQVLVNVNGASFDDQRASVEDAFDEPTVEVDLADAAYRTSEGSLVAMKVGSLFVQVSYLPPGAGDVADATVALAGNVLSRLG